VSDDLDGARSWPVTLDEQDRLPGPEVGSSVRNGNCDRLTEEGGPNVGIGVVVYLVVAPAIVWNETFQCPFDVRQQTALGLLLDTTSSVTSMTWMGSTVDTENSVCISVLPLPIHIC
jgi:hypothetical protein